MLNRHFCVAQALVPVAPALLPTVGELCSPGKLKHAPPMRRRRLEMAKLQATALVPMSAFDAMLPPRTGVETSLDTAGLSACATYFAQGRGMGQKLWGGQCCPREPAESGPEGTPQPGLAAPPWESVRNAA